MLGQLLGLLMTQEKDIRRSAEELLRLTSPYGRVVAGYCLRSLKRDSGPFGEDRPRCSRFGVTASPLNHAGTLPQHLQPLFAGELPVCQPEHLLEALVLPDKGTKTWAREWVEWEQPESVKAFFAGTDSTVLASSFLRASSSPDAETRQLAGILVVGIGPRVLETPHHERLIQRVVFLAAHDPDASVRPAGRKAAEAIGITDRIPNTPAPPPPPENNSPSSEPDIEDAMLDELLGELESHVGFE